jgi:hypothetical protein
MSDQTWKKNATDALLDERVEFVPFNFLEDAPVVGKDVYYVRTGTSFRSSPVIYY